MVHAAEADEGAAPYADLLRSLRTPPPAAAAVKVLESTRGCSVRTEPAVVRGATAGWRAEERWRSAEALCTHYGATEFTTGAEFINQLSLLGKRTGH